MPSFPTAAAQYIAAIARSHTGTKPVLAQPLHPLWLIGSLHNILRLWLKGRVEKSMQYSWLRVGEGSISPQACQERLPNVTWETDACRTQAILVQCQPISKPVRAWVWHRGEGVRPTIEERNWRLVGSSLEANTSLSLTIGDLVPGQRSELTLVVAGPEGQQRLLVQEATTQDW